MNGPNGQKKEEPTTLQRMKGGLVASALFHIAVVVLMIVGLPYIAPKRDIPQMISVELATVADITQTNKPPVDAPKPKDPKDEPPKPTKKVPPKPAPTPDKPKPQEPKVEEKKPVEVKKDTPEQDELAPPKKEPEKKPDKKPEVKKPEPKKEEPKKDTPEFDSLLKNLTKDEPVQENKDDINKLTDALATPTPTPDAPVGEQLTSSDIDALRQQLAGCWNVFAGASEAGDLSVDVRVIVNQDRTVKDASIVDQSRYNADDRFRAAAESALRAVRDPRCSPLNLPPEKYTLWHDMIVNFDPKDML